jgi:hypothetical protein
VTDLTPATSYCFRVGAVNSAAAVYSNMTCGATEALPPPPVPEAPSNLHVSAFAYQTPVGFIEMQWTDNATNEDGYEVSLRRPYVDYTWPDTHKEQIPANPGTGTMNYTFHGYAAGYDWCLRATAYNAQGATFDEICQMVGTPVEQPQTFPDLKIVGSMLPYPQLPDPWTPFVITWKVCNQGNASTGTGFTDVLDLIDGNTWSLEWGAWEANHCEWEEFKTDGQPAGSYYFYSYLDFFNQVAESDEGNNVLGTGVIVQ